MRHAEATKNKDMLIAISERLVDLSPDDYRTRFGLAYMHSEAGNNDLSLNHYLFIPPSERNALGWNNLGAAFQHFRLPIKAVRAYRKSEELNETLAMANLGYAMLNVGLLAEARAICEKALAHKGFHKNVGHLLVRLNDVSAEEDKAQDEVLEKSRPKIEFYRGFARSLSLAEPKRLDGAWASPECAMNVVVANAEIEISGDYEQNANSYGVVGMLSLRRMVRRHVQYRGTFSGRAVFATVQRSEDGSSVAASLLGQSGEGKVLMYVSDDETEINVMENPSALYPNIFSMKRTS
jgi:tetratricopeptide (TPR) repeat protein